MMWKPSVNAIWLRAAPRFDARVSMLDAPSSSDLRAETRLDQPCHGHPMWMSRPRWEARTVTPMAEVVETRDLTDPSQNGWALDYRIRREDGEELHAEVRCWNKAHAAAERAGSAEALAAIADRGSAAALEYAELVESPATRGAVLISIWFDPADEGKLRRRVSYERAPA